MGQDNSADGSFTTHPRSLASNDTYTWGGNGGEDWNSVINTQSGTRVLDNGTITSDEGTATPIAQSNLVAWYRFENSDVKDAATTTAFSDSTAYDGNVNGPTHLPDGGVTDIQNGPTSGAFDYSGGGDDIVIDSGIPVSTGTITFWYKDPGTNGYSIFIGKNSTNYIAVGRDNKSTMELRYSSDTRPKTDPGVNVLDGSWHHVAFRTDGSTFSAITDGTNKSSTNANGAVFDSYMNIGDPYGSTRWNFVGTVDDVRFYDTLLRDSEIETIYTTTSP